MDATIVSLNTKIPKEEKDLFAQTAADLGMTPSSVIKVFVRKFNEYGGFPFEVRSMRRGAFLRGNEDMLYQLPRSADGTAILPTEWDDEEGDVYESFV